MTKRKEDEVRACSENVTGGRGKVGRVRTNSQGRGKVEGKGEEDIIEGQR